ncbi:MAG: hypothetical protein K5868_09925 [Lachnospiraceae bacterium]|nr:hypothetical protein [Lachnospiraceae bacterium]
MCRLAELHTNFDSTVMVAENKLDILRFIIDTASQCSKIDAIILFSSTLDERCRDDSDIDIVIISNATLSVLSRQKSFTKFKKDLYLKNMSQKYDFLYFKSMDEIKSQQDKSPLCNELVRNGQFIYRKQVA